MQEITTLLQRGELTQALTLLEPLSKRHPADPIIAGLLGRARLHAGDAKGAIQPLQTSLEQLKQDGEGFSNLGVALMQLERTAEAAQAFAQAVVLMPRQAQAWRNLAGAYTRLGRTDDALKAWRRYISFKPQDAEARCVYGGLLLAAERFRDAAIHLKFGAKVTQDTVCLHDYADTLGRLRQPAEALKILERLIRIDRRNAHAHYLRAYILIDAPKQRPQAALDAIEESLKIDPKRAASHHLKGYILERDAQHEAALQAYARAVDLDPKNSRFEQAWAIARVHVGEGKKARKVLLKILRREPENVDVRRALAHVFMDAKDWKEAELLLLTAPQKNTMIEIDLAAARLSAGKIDEALKALKALSKREPNNRLVVYNLSLALRRSGAMQQAYLRARSARMLPGSGEDELLLEVRLLLELGRAQEALTLLNATALAPSYDLQFVRTRCLRLMARLPEALKASERTEASAQSEDQRLAVRRLRGKILTDLGRSAEAIGLFRERGASPAELGIALSRAGRAKEALKVLGGARKRGDANVEVELAYAASLGQLGRHDAALKTLTAARKRFPRHGGLTNDTAMAWLAKGQKRRAIRLLEQGLKENPGHSTLARNFAQHLVDTKRYNDAIQLLRKTIRLRPHEGVLQTTLGEVLMTLKRNEEARAAFNQALEAGTPDVLAQARLGDLERRAGRLEAAINRSQTALKAKANMIEAHNGLGMALHGLERFDQAVHQYRKGLAYKPRDPELHNNLGSSFYLKGEFASALTAFERASQANPQEPRFWRNQLMILKEQGRLEDAEARLAQALRVLPNNASLKNEALSLERAKAARERIRATP